MITQEGVIMPALVTAINYEWSVSSDEVSAQSYDHMSSPV